MEENEFFESLETACKKLFQTPLEVKDNNQIVDATKSWVIYQVGFDENQKERLDFVANLINCLPDLIKDARKNSIEGKDFDVENADKITAQIKKLIAAAMFEHETRKHSSLG